MTTYAATHKVMAIHSPQPVFVLKGIPYYPHFIKANCWVPPGAFIKQHNVISKMQEYKEDVSKHFQASELVAAGAEIFAQYMWNREWTNGWQQW